MIRKLLGLEKIDYIEKELIEKSRDLKRDISAYIEILLNEDDIKAKKEQIEKQKEQSQLYKQKINKKKKEKKKKKIQKLEIKKQ